MTTLEKYDIVLVINIYDKFRDLVFGYLNNKRVQGCVLSRQFWLCLLDIFYEILRCYFNMGIHTYL